MGAATASFFVCGCDAQDVSVENGVSLEGGLQHILAMDLE